jgi:hypothetical protein
VAPDHTFAIVGGPWCPILDFVIVFLNYDYVLHILNFAIRFDFNIAVSMNK